MNTHLDEAQLHDCADDTLAAASRAGVDAHLAGCTACRDAVAGIRQLRSELAALPRAIAPPAHVLMDVRRRVAEEATPARLHAWPWYARPRMLAAAAVLLIAISSAATVLLLRYTSDADAAGPAATAIPLTTGRATSLAAVHAMERSYQAAIAEVQRALGEQQTGLAPETVRVLQTNLDIIDRALAEARTALRADPGNDALTALLRSGYERKLDVLRSASSHARASS